MLKGATVQAIKDMAGEGLSVAMLNKGFSKIRVKEDLDNMFQDFIDMCGYSEQDAQVAVENVLAYDYL